MQRTSRSNILPLLATIFVALSSARLATSQSLTTADITDPANGLKAFTITIPAGWKFQGTVLPGPDCSSVPSPVFRTYSTDGLTEIRLMPAFDWTFHPNLKMKTPNGCVDFGHTLTAAEFLKHYEEMIATNGMRVIGPMPIAPSYQKRVDGVARNMSNISPDIRGSADAAAVRVETPNGSFIIEQRLRAYVECRVSNRTGPLAGGGCSAHVDVLRAPKGKLDALAQLVDAHDLVRTPYENAWLQQVRQATAELNRRRADELHQQQQAGNAMLRQQHEQFMATMQHNHEAFMAQQESTFHSSMNNSINAMNARTTAASDWVDYSLDQQTVSGPGGTAKVSSAYGHTWSSTTGNQTQWYQTTDPNTNPNGVLPGNWVENTKVHGNGQAY
jgi:hypothetical protein